MTGETFLMPVTRYIDKDGNPTCATDFNVGKVCQFYTTQRFGCDETCLFANKEWRYWITLFRRDSGNGSLIPLVDCPIWSAYVPDPLGVGA